MSDCISYIKTAISNQASVITNAYELTPYLRGPEGLDAYMTTKLVSQTGL